jgi:hypothetical protein
MRIAAQAQVPRGRAHSVRLAIAGSNGTAHCRAFIQFRAEKAHR